MKNNKTIKIATVFSGIGAAEYALSKLNVDHEIVFACDNGERELDLTREEIETLINNKDDDKTVEEIIQELYNDTKKPNYVKESYMANYELEEKKWYEDIRFLDGKKYRDEIDLFIGGSPCQSFSTYGNKLGLEDTRGTLFYDYARLVQEIQPKVFIFENVTGLLNHDKGNTWKVISQVFDSLHYDIKLQVLNAKDYNLPHLRRRVFVVGFRRDLKIENYNFPEKVELMRSSTDYLEKNIDNKYYLAEKGFKFVTDPSRNGRRARVNQDVIGCQTANQQFNWVGDFRVESPEKRHYEDGRIYIGEYEGQPAVARKMTPNELLGLMGFDDFNIVVKDTVMYRQTGNSIAVPVMQAIIESIIIKLESKK